jgi:UDP-N-acetylmuramoyl-L-alanyl-D-glutamate--2,6-diaminopimelate ligase
MKSPSRKLHILFGCGGDRDTTKRPEMGRIAEHYSDLLWITPDNPRSESIADINAEILTGLSTDQFCIFDDRGKGLQKAISQLESSDILVVLGKGRENGQEIDGQTHPYSDIEIIEKAVHAN